MISKLLEFIFAYVKGKPYWAKLEPVAVLISLYVISIVFTFEYVQWRYHFSPSIWLFATSYIVKQITIVFAAFALLLLEFSKRSNERPHLRAKVTQWLRAGARKLIVSGIVLLIAMGLLLYVSPHRVRDVKLKYLDEPRFNKEAFTYIVYELNREQVTWHFTVDFDTFKPDALTSEETKRCDGAPLCYAEMVAGTDTLIGITSRQLGQDTFWQNSNNVSVISVDRWERFSPPSIYEYLAYSLVVQSTMIHLNRYCKGLPANAFVPGRSAYGDLFEFSPRRNEIKAAVLAAHLSPKGEELLGNCFGMEYMNTCSRLLSLDWLRSPRIRENLKKDFNVEL
jgi:hypothetical protein